MTPRAAWVFRLLLVLAAAVLGLADLVDEPLGILTVSIPSSPALPSPQALPPGTHAVLTTARRAPLIARLDRRNRCIFSAVPPGEYLLEVISRDVAFEAMRVDVVDVTDELERQRQDKLLAEAHKRAGTAPAQDLADQTAPTVVLQAWQSFRGHPWGNTGEWLGIGKTSLEISARPIGPRVFFEPRQGFSPVSLLTNPMILIGLAGLGMMVGMPKLMENMDPEMRKEFEEQQRKNPITSGLGGGGNPIGNFDMAAWMAGSGSSSKNDEGSSAEPAGGGKARKRA